MDTRLLEYFLAIAEEGNMTRAAENLHVTQPTLSKQLRKLEEMLGVELFERANRRMILTDAGLKLRDRARVILELMGKTFTDLQDSEEEIHGTVKMSVAESEAFRELVQVFKVVREKYPAIKFDIHSGDATDVVDRLDEGTIDFGLFVGMPSLEKYHTLKLPAEDRWGVLCRKDDALADEEEVTAGMLEDKPLIVSRQSLIGNELSGWLGYPLADANIVSTYSLINNAAVMAEEGFGYVLCLDRLANTTETSPLTFIPLRPEMTAPLHLVWRKNHLFSAAAEVFLEEIRNSLLA